MPCVALRCLAFTLAAPGREKNRLACPFSLPQLVPSWSGSLLCTFRRFPLFPFPPKKNPVALLFRLSREVFAHLGWAWTIFLPPVLHSVHARLEAPTAATPASCPQLPFCFARHLLKQAKLPVAPILQRPPSRPRYVEPARSQAAAASTLLLSSSSPLSSSDSRFAWRFDNRQNPPSSAVVDSHPLPPSCRPSRFPSSTSIATS